MVQIVTSLTFSINFFKSDTFLLSTLSIQVSSYTNIFGTVQMMEAFCLAPFVGLVIDLSGIILKKLNPSIKDEELRMKGLDFKTR